MSLRAQRQTNTPPGYPASSYAWYVVGILVLATLLSYTDRQILSLLVDPIRHDLAISDTQVGLLMGTAFALVYGAAGVPLGWLADRLRRRDLIVAGIVLWSLGTVCCGLSHNFAQFFAARLLVGIGEAVLTPASISMISDSFPPSRRGPATSVFLMGIAMGAGGPSCLAASFSGSSIQAFCARRCLTAKAPGAWFYSCSASSASCPRCSCPVSRSRNGSTAKWPPPHSRHLLIIGCGWHPFSWHWGSHLSSTMPSLHGHPRFSFAVLACRRPR